MMANLGGKPGELHFTVTVKRAETGLEETIEMVGVVEGMTGDEAEALMTELGIPVVKPELKE
jgi:hypothetical protein